jgi:uncharacterized lipoprotein YajG
MKLFSLLVLLVAGLALAGCDKNTQDKANDASKATNAAPTAPK